jgi:uncharacterized protein (TIGR02145 family)
MTGSNNHLNESIHYRNDGLASVRCVRDGDYYTLTTNVSPSGGGSVSLSPSQTKYASGTSVTVTATAKSGYSFSNWRVSGKGTFANAKSASTYVTVNGNVTVTANFYGTLSYGYQTYKTVTIGSQTWMAENLNIETTDSWCYKDSTSYCNKYGRLYTWEAAKSACELLGGSWHLPKGEEWDSLARRVCVTEWMYENVAGKYLKSTSGWNDNGNGTDDFGFSALPGGYRYYGGGSFGNAGDFGYWWTATEDGSSFAYYRSMGYSREDVNEYWDGKSSGFSVRCVGD